MLTTANFIHTGQEEIQDIKEYMRSLKHGGLALPIKTLLKDALKSEKLNEEKQYIPREQLVTICNPQAVYSELQQHFNDQQAQDYARYTCNPKKPARRIFAILVLINHIEFVPKFKDAGIVDDDLPFTGSEEQRELWSRHSTEGEPIQFFDYSTDAEMMREFYVKQWWEQAPPHGEDHISGQPAHFRDSIIPWTFSGVKIDTGGFGIVEMVHINGKHHSYYQHGRFALKTFHPNYEDVEERFWQEVGAFRKLSPGPRLVELCASFEITTQNTFMLLFPWAEGGSLSDLISRPKEELYGISNKTQETFFEWIAIECRGLVEALQTIHDTRIGRSHYDSDNNIREDDGEYRGIHGDIKPSNILYFSQETQRHPFGTLKLADFGLMRFCSPASPATNRAVAYAASQTYRSPEHDISYIMSNKVDIWALGCVYSELLTWAILHPRACEDYLKARMQELSYSGATQNKGQWHEDNFFLSHLQARKARKASSRQGYTYVGMAIFGPGDISIEKTPRLKTSVSQWVQKLVLAAKGEQGQMFFTEFLGFIEKGMLHPDREQRADCERILDFFQALEKKGC
ncbi:hypothetical protein FSARC_7299 [Fusarium sarcochroum]|uniref:Protein kinase domain-containing protein n=1 Tax=Fusarium sarcochroum TaxID=1208366 RepID=A0A8H4TVK6_9HYPO|nr:hypothetical protein FSARC_7299 [Fusarium sarcochroum]